MEIQLDELLSWFFPPHIVNYIVDRQFPPVVTRLAVEEQDHRPITSFKIFANHKRIYVSADQAAIHICWYINIRISDGMELLLPITIILSREALAVEKIFERKVFHFFIVLWWWCCMTQEERKSWALKCVLQHCKPFQSSFHTGTQTSAQAPSNHP